MSRLFSLRAPNLPPRAFSSIPPSAQTPTGFLSQMWWQRFLRQAQHLAQEFTLTNIRDNPGAKKPAVRVGRGIGSGKGKTCGHGHKGQKSRAGNSKPALGFEGGQTPLYLRAPKRGFHNVNEKKYEPVNIGKLQQLIDMGRLNPEQEITTKTLHSLGVIKRVEHGVKILADGAELLQKPIRLAVHQVSQNALQAIQKVGGQVKLVDLTPMSLRKYIRGKLEIDPHRITDAQMKPSTAPHSSMTRRPNLNGYVPSRKRF